MTPENQAATRYQAAQEIMKDVQSERVHLLRQLQTASNKNPKNHIHRQLMAANKTIKECKKFMGANDNPQPQVKTSATAPNIGMILPTATTSRIPQADINLALTAIIDGVKTTEPLTLRIMAGKNASITAVKKAAQNHPNITITIHTPNTKIKTSSRNIENRREAGRLATQIDRLLVIDSARDSKNNIDRQIINKAKKRKITIKTITIPAMKQPLLLPKENPNQRQRGVYRVNIRDFSTWKELEKDPHTHGPNDESPVYVGNAGPAAQSKGITIKSPLANPYLNDPQWPEKYRTWIWEKITANDPEVMAELRKITQTTPLVCWCKHSKKCHSDIIRKAARYIARLDKAAPDQAEPIMCCKLTATGTRCKRTAKYNVIFKNDPNHSPVCTQHKNQLVELLKITNVSTPEINLI